MTGTISFSNIRLRMWPGLLTVLLAATICLAAAPADATAKPTFSPKKVAAGGKVLVKAGTASKTRTVTLGFYDQPHSSDAMLGLLPDNKAQRQFKVPGAVLPGKYFVRVCIDANCHVANGKLTVTKKKAKPRFRVRYVHVERDRDDSSEHSPEFRGTVLYRHNLKLTSNIPIRGKKGRGQAAIRYDRAIHRTVQTGEWPDPNSQGDWCQGTRRSVLKRTWNGKARVLRLKVKPRQRKVALDLSPGPIYQQALPPSERIRTVWTHQGGSQCAQLDISPTPEVNQLFLEGFAGIHSLANRLKVRSNPTGDVYFARFNRGWKVRPKRKKGFAKLVVKTKFGGLNSVWKDTIVIDKLR